VRISRMGDRALCPRCHGHAYEFVVRQSTSYYLVAMGKS
jgi:hypothetical protein